MSPTRPKRAWWIVLLSAPACPTTEPKRESTTTCLVDLDQDGFYASGCADVAEEEVDCDDTEPGVHPGANESCDDRDQDCDGVDDQQDSVVDGLPYFVDADGDGYGDDGSVTTACSRREGLTISGGDCDDRDPTISPGATEQCDSIDQDCDGTAGDAAGGSAECAITTCLEAKEAGATEDGVRWLSLPSGTVAPVWCDMNTDGGGWTLAFLRNTVGTGSHGDFGAEDLPTGLDVAPDEASASAIAYQGWLDLNQLSYTTLRLSAHRNGQRTWLSHDIGREELRIAFGDDGYFLYGGASGYYWCGGDATYTDGGIGGVANPSGATSDCKGHGSLGSGWDFSEADVANSGLTLCGGDASAFLSASWAGDWISYGNAGGAQAIWVR